MAFSSIPVSCAFFYKGVRFVKNCATSAECANYVQLFAGSDIIA